MLSHFPVGNCTNSIHTGKFLHKLCTLHTLYLQLCTTLPRKIPYCTLVQVNNYTPSFHYCDFLGFLLLYFTKWHFFAFFAQN
jgi:hypothetical protein